MLVKGAVDPGITYSMSYAEWEAAHDVGLDLWLWETNYYPKQFKTKIIAFHRLKKAVEMHVQDAVNAKQEREAKKHASR